MRFLEIPLVGPVGVGAIILERVDLELRHIAQTSRDNGDGWWRYTLPGYGRILWGDFITTLRKIGYDDVLSIEHEDSAFPAEEGFVKAARYLNTLV